MTWGWDGLRPSIHPEFCGRKTWILRASYLLSWNPESQEALHQKYWFASNHPAILRDELDCSDQIIATSHDLGPQNVDKEGKLVKYYNLARIAGSSPSPPKTLRPLPSHVDAEVQVLAPSEVVVSRHRRFSGRLFRLWVEETRSNMWWFQLNLPTKWDPHNGPKNIFRDSKIFRVGLGNSMGKGSVQMALKMAIWSICLSQLPNSQYLEDPIGG